ncbi:MAG: fibronectin type III domain-containing protein [Terriglobia bacterium]
MKPYPREPRAAAPKSFFRQTCLSKRILQALVLASAAAWLYACGVQGTPHPPHLERPEKIANLSVVQVGQSLQVRFTLPQQTTEGTRLTKPLEVEILRAVVPQTAGLAKLPEPEVWTRLIREEWLPYAKGNDVSYSAHLTEREFHDWHGKTLVVGVRTLTRGFRHRALESDPSNLVDVPILDVSEPVGNVHFAVTERAVEVHFTAPTKTLSGEPVHGLTGYRAYRSSTGQAGSFEPLGETRTPPYRDGQFEFGQTYYYQVAAVFGTPGHPAMSDASPAVKVTPRDVFPPAPPQGLSSIYSAGAVELVWAANSEADLAGYNVYRLDNQTPQRVNKDLLHTPIFRDTTAPPGKTLIYYVTAVDLSGNESKGSQKEEVETK